MQARRARPRRPTPAGLPWLLSWLLPWLLIGGCVSVHRGGDERWELYRRHAGAPVASFELTRLVRQGDWTPLDERSLVVWSSPSRGHLLELTRRCPGLPAAHTVSITNAFGNVRARFDSVTPRSATAPSGPPCRILRIRPLDGRALRDEQREIRRADYVERPPDVQPDPAAAGPDTP